MFTTFLFINYVCSSRCLTDGEDVGGAPDESVDVCCVGGGERNGNEGCTKRTRSTSMDEFGGAVLAAALNADVKAVAAQRVW